MLRPLQAQQLLLGGKMHTRSKACIAFRMLDDKPWHGEPPPVRRDGGDAFSHLSDDERDPKHWALPTQPNLGKLKQMVLAVKQIIGHFKGGKLDGKRWQLRHMHALWNVFFPGTPSPQKLSDLQMHELEADFHRGKIVAVILEAKCALFGDDLLNTAGNAQPAAAATLNALAGGVSVEHRIPDPQPVRTIRGRRITCKKPAALRATPAGADDRLALRQWLFHPLLTQARLRHPTFCP